MIQARSEVKTAPGRGNSTIQGPSKKFRIRTVVCKLIRYLLNLKKIDKTTPIIFI